MIWTSGVHTYSVTVDVSDSYVAWSLSITNSGSGVQCSCTLGRTRCSVIKAALVILVHSYVIYIARWARASVCVQNLIQQRKFNKCDDQILIHTLILLLTGKLGDQNTLYLGYLIHRAIYIECTFTLQSSEEEAEIYRNNWSVGMSLCSRIVDSLQSVTNMFINMELRTNGWTDVLVQEEQQQLGADRSENHVQEK